MPRGLRHSAPYVCLAIAAILIKIDLATTDEIGMLLNVKVVLNWYEGCLRYLMVFYFQHWVDNFSNMMTKIIIIKCRCYHNRIMIIIISNRCYIMWCLEEVDIVRKVWPEISFCLFDRAEIRIDIDPCCGTSASTLTLTLKMSKHYSFGVKNSWSEECLPLA